MPIKYSYDSFHFQKKKLPFPFSIDKIYPTITLGLSYTLGFLHFTCLCIFFAFAFCSHRSYQFLFKIHTCNIVYITIKLINITIYHFEPITTNTCICRHNVLNFFSYPGSICNYLHFLF